MFTRKMRASAALLTMDVKNHYKVIAEHGKTHSKALIIEARKALKVLARLINVSQIEDDNFIGIYRTLGHIGGWHKARPTVEKPPIC